MRLCANTTPYGTSVANQVTLLQHSKVLFNISTAVSAVYWVLRTAGDNDIDTQFARCKGFRNGNYTRPDNNWWAVWQGLRQSYTLGEVKDTLDADGQNCTYLHFGKVCIHWSTFMTRRCNDDMSRTGAAWQAGMLVRQWSLWARRLTTPWWPLPLRC